MLGQVIRRSEKDNQAQAGDPHEIWHRMSGRQMGYVGNNGNYDVTYFTSRHQRQTAGGPGTGSFADFDLAHDHINSYEQGARGGVYTAHAGDTLSGIAANLWGDASLWYKIAEVNGLTAESVLIEGQPLLIPTGVQRNENNANTFQPYDPLEVLGNTSPTSPTPSNVKQCGTVGKVMLAIVTFAVAYWVDPYLANAVQQGLMIATGHQEEFSWEQFAAAAITAGITSNVPASWGQSAASAMTSNAAAQEIVGAAVNGAIGSAVSQGVSMALGIQDKFSWAAVAGAAVGAAAGAWAMPQARLAHIADKHGASQFASASFIRASASGVANAATRSLMNDGDFGDNMLAALPDVIGQTMAAVAGASRSGAPQSGGASGLDRMQLDGLDALGATPSTPELDALMAQVDALDASAYALLNGEAAGLGYQTHSVVRGDRLETILRSTYGDENYRAAMPRVMADNDIQLNRYGSPMIYPGDELVLRDIGGMDSATFAQASAWSGDLIANNAQGLSQLRLNEAMNTAFSVMAFGDWAAAQNLSGLKTPIDRTRAGFDGALSGIGDGAVRWGRDTLTGLAMMARSNLSTTTPLGAQFDLFYGGNVPEWAPSLVREMGNGYRFATQDAPALGRAATGFLLEHPEAIFGGTLGLQYAISVETTEALGRRWDAFRAQDAVDPYGAWSGLTSDITYGGLTVASVVVAPEVLAGRLPALMATGLRGLRVGLDIDVAASQGALGALGHIRFRRTPAPLLPGEGNVGTYGDLITAGSFGDNISPHHIPSRLRMEAAGVSKNDGIAINMEHPVPGVGGRHRATFTNGTAADLDMTARGALAAGVWDARKIYRGDGLYTPQIRSSLQELIRMNKIKYPTIFAK